MSQCSKLAREEKEGAQEWMGQSRVKKNEFASKERDRRPKEQFITGVNDDNIMTEIIKKLVVTKRPMK